MGLGLCVVGLPLLTWAMLASGVPAPRESILLVYLLAVVLTAVVGGLLPGFVAAVVGFLGANWFLTPPFATLDVGQPEALVDLVVFVLVAVVVSIVVELGARDRARAERHRQALARAAARAEQLVETDRVRSALLTAVSHDLRTPIAGIKAAASGLREAEVEWSEEDQDELLAAIEDGSDALATLVDDILAVSRIKAGAVSVQLAAVSVGDALERAFAEHPDHEVTLQVPASLPDVRADDVLLQRVMANLLDNARRFTPATHAVEVVADAVSPVASRSTVRIRIIDHGCGVPEDRWQEMFRPFQRLGDTSTGGLGLGLAIAKGLTEAMSGTLTPQRTPGGGLTMSIELPAAS